MKRRMEVTNKLQFKSDAAVQRGCGFKNAQGLVQEKVSPLFPSVVHSQPLHLLGPDGRNPR
jgi:hypothetical protein